jgi:hypothetical protein
MAYNYRKKEKGKSMCKRWIWDEASCFSLRALRLMKNHCGCGDRRLD